MGSLRENRTICLYRKGRVKWIGQSKFLIDKNTPRGEPANYYEAKPYGGKRLLEQGEYLGEIKYGRFEIADCNMTNERWSVIIGLNIPLSTKLFHNGRVYTTFDNPFKTLKQSLSEMKPNG